MKTKFPAGLLDRDENHNGRHFMAHQLVTPDADEDCFLEANGIQPGFCFVLDDTHVGEILFM